MPARSVSEDPCAGDQIRWKPYTVTVKSREGDQVCYTVSGSREAPRESTQTITQWSAWTKGAKIKQRAPNVDECVILKLCCSGACRFCGVWMDREVHSTDEGLTCAACCKKEKHK